MATAATVDDTSLGTAIIFLTEVWGLSAADAWLILKPQSRVTTYDSAGAQGRRLIGQRRRRQPPYSPLQGQKLSTALNLFVLAELLKLRRADACERQPRYTRGHRRLRSALNLILLEKLHGMPRAKAWRALNPQSKAFGESAAAVARREVAWQRNLHARALDAPARSEPDVSDDLAELLPSWLRPIPVEPLSAWYARMLQEQANREIPEAARPVRP